MAAVLDWFRPKGRHHAITEASPGKTVALSPSKSVVRAGYTYGVPPGGLNDGCCGRSSSPASGAAGNRSRCTGRSRPGRTCAGRASASPGAPWSG